MFGRKHDGRGTYDGTEVYDDRPLEDRYDDRAERSREREREREDGLDARRDGVMAAPAPQLGRRDRRRLWAEDAGLLAARRRFGGADLGASLAGMVAGVGLVIILAGIASGVGTVGYQRGVGSDQLSAGGLITGLVILFLGFLFGGWVAGRMARYDGGRNGLVAGLLFIVLAAVLGVVGAVAGDRYDVFTRADLPRWFTGAEGTMAAIGSAVVGAILVLVGGVLGGVLGSRYHRRADALIAATDRAAATRAMDRDAAVAGPADVELDRRTAAVDPSVRR